MQTAKADMPILGITTVEQRDRLEDTETTNHVGPCSGCGSVEWVSHKSEEKGWLCGSCWYGPQWEGTDPVVRDIEMMLTSTWHSFAQAIEDEESIEEAISTLTLSEATIDDVHCPQCHDEVEPEHMSVGTITGCLCPMCQEQAAEEVQG
jgi:hypothetical protein